MGNQLILGDNLGIMRQLPNESIDLIYLDPPFFSNRNYEVIWGDEGEIRSFHDRWSGGIEHYIGWLKERVQEMHRLLKPTGSIFLHCDWHANAYIRVYILDKIFGEKNFRNEIVWYYGPKATQNESLFQRKHDTILFYSKQETYKFQVQLQEYSEGSLAERNTRYSSKDKEGRYRMTTRRDSAGNKYRAKVYLREGVAMTDVWEIGVINATAKERIGYPTQKPESLLERVILAATEKADVILDPFVGGGTTVAVADRLERQWIGIDQSVQAIKVTEMRLYKQRDLFSVPFAVQLHKYDYDTLRYQDAFEFEAWIVQQYGGTSNTKQRGDLGIDGRTHEGTPIQVKRSDNIGRNIIDNLRSACERFDENLFNKNKTTGQPVGVLIAFSFGKGAVEEVARLKIQQNTVIKLVTVEEIVPIAKKPKISVKFRDLGADDKGNREIEFTALGESEAGIEMYAWDWEYDEAKQVFKPEVLMDRAGVQQHKFKPGEHVIAVRVVDNDGLESDEVVRLKVNGKIKRL